MYGKYAYSKYLEENSKKELDNSKTTLASKQKALEVAKKNKEQQAEKLSEDEKKAQEKLEELQETNDDLDKEIKKAQAAIEAAMDNQIEIFLSTQKDYEIEEPDFEDIFEIGTICRIKQIIKLPITYQNYLIFGKTFINTNPLLVFLKKISMPMPLPKKL